jgi:hypothetical protein
MTQTANKPDGRSREARAARAAAAAPQAMPIDHSEEVVQRQPSRAAARLGIRQDAPREAPRTTSRGGPVYGRDGELLSRKRTAVGDPFDIPANLIEPGWELQWIAISVVGNTEVVMDQNLNMLENGWRPVPASRFPGRFMPGGTSPSAHIVRGGQGLYERPKQLCDEARAEDVRLAKQLISDRNDSLKLSGVKKELGAGFEMSRKYRGTGGDMRMSIDPALDIPTPSHQLAEPGE